jgi:hypothetical protein
MAMNNQESKRIQEHIQGMQRMIAEIDTATGYIDKQAATQTLEANAESWFRESITLLEQQQREIETKDELLERILKIYINHKEAKYHNPTSIELIGKLVEMHLDSNKEVSTDVQT